MWWILVWALLALGALAFLGWLVWRLVRQVIGLGRELGRSADRAGPYLDRISEPYQPAASVLVDPAQVAPAPARRTRRRPGR